MWCRKNAYTWYLNIRAVGGGYFKPQPPLFVCTNVSKMLKKQKTLYFVIIADVCVCLTEASGWWWLTRASRSPPCGSSVAKTASCLRTPCSPPQTSRSSTSAITSAKSSGRGRRYRCRSAFAIHHSPFIQLYSNVTKLQTTCNEWVSECV